MTTELAITLPVFLLLIFGVLETGRALWTQAALQNGAKIAARCSALGASGCTTPTQTQSYAATNSYGLDPPASSFTVTAKACGQEVAASYPYESVVMGLVPYNLTLTARSCYPMPPS